MANITCSICRKKDSKKKCSHCSMPICSFLCFTQSNHQLICAKRERDLDEDEKDFTGPLIQLIVENYSPNPVKDFLDTHPHLRILPEYAQYAKSPTMCEFLIERGADVYAYIGNGRLALDECVKHFSILPFLKQANEPKPDIIMSARWGQGFRVVFLQPDKRFFVQLVRSGSDNLEAELTVELFRLLIYHKYFPKTSAPYINLPKYEKILEDIFFDRYNNDTIRFWTGSSISEHLSKISEFVFFDNQKIEFYRIRRATSFPSLLFDQDKLYKESRRPITDMSIFRRYPIKQLTSRPDDKENFYPVTRYGAGMSHGLYHVKNADDEKEYCGTFYYLEPESTTFLHFDNPLDAGYGKTDAYFFLKSKTTATNKELVLDTEDENEIQIESRRIRNGGNLFFTPQEFVQYLVLNYNLSEEVLYTLYGSDASALKKIPTLLKFLAIQRINFAEIFHNPNLQLERSFYCAHLLNAYASEDRLDQPICEMAKMLGYDGIVLRGMVGSRQVVTEILDTRQRMDSFANLYYLKN